MPVKQHLSWCNRRRGDSGHAMAKFDRSCMKVVIPPFAIAEILLEQLQQAETEVQMCLGPKFRVGCPGKLALLRSLPHM
uniref:Predicted protein n=1 Tax=Hordeum vulgare subsp. vulgare TaxID=112509 RepID=F2EAT8_HORVV|nr:predicted protein [Hordeum vulgare subsp. vulgare]